MAKEDKSGYSLQSTALLISILAAITTLGGWVYLRSFYVSLGINPAQISFNQHLVAAAGLVVIWSIGFPLLVVTGYTLFFYLYRAIVYILAPFSIDKEELLRDLKKQHPSIRLAVTLAIGSVLAIPLSQILLTKHEIPIDLYLAVSLSLVAATYFILVGWKHAQPRNMVLLATITLYGISILLVSDLGGFLKAQNLLRYLEGVQLTTKEEIKYYFGTNTFAIPGPFPVVRVTTSVHLPIDPLGEDGNITGLIENKGDTYSYRLILISVDANFSHFLEAWEGDSLTGTVHSIPTGSVLHMQYY